MTRFPSSAVLACTLLLGACTGPSGQPARGFLNAEVQAAYIPLHGTAYVVLDGDAAAVALGDGVAVTTGHTANLVEEGAVIGTSRDYDLMFFRIDHAGVPLQTEVPRVGMRVIAYGEYDGALRVAEGNVTRLDAPVEPNCEECAVQTAFTFEGDAGPGFSGGPVIDAATGKLVGIVFGYTEDGRRGRTIYAYSMDRVMAELKAITSKLPLGRVSAARD